MRMSTVKNVHTYVLIVKVISITFSSNKLEIMVTVIAMITFTLQVLDMAPIFDSGVELK